MANRSDYERLAEAMRRDDLETVQAMMTRDPELHRSPLGYGGDGPLTWLAECHAPGADRLAMAEWMILNGSDVHQGGDGPLMRAALRAERIPMMELLVAHGAEPNCRDHAFSVGGHAYPGTALDFLIAGYGRWELAAMLARISNKSIAKAVTSGITLFPHKQLYTKEKGFRYDSVYPIQLRVCTPLSTVR